MAPRRIQSDRARTGLYGNGRVQFRRNSTWADSGGWKKRFASVQWRAMVRHAAWPRSHPNHTEDPRWRALGGIGLRRASAAERRLDLERRTGRLTLRHRVYGVRG